MAKKAQDSKYLKGKESILGYSPADDGKTHINIHSCAKTELGRLLSHFAHLPFTHQYLGPFYSMEGFWYFARAGFNEKVANRMRYLSGFRAKQVGRMLPNVFYTNFEEDILAANYQKIIQNEKLYKLFVESDLPLDHYYTFGPGDVVVTPKSGGWLTEGFEDIRNAMKEGVIPSVWLSAEKRYLQQLKE